jgi:hypothetical protein
VDASHFDRLVRAWTERRPRRGLLGLLATLPFLGVLAELLSDEAAADGRRKRRKKPHHHRKRTGNRAGKNKKKKRSACDPEPRAETCAGRCGPVKNDCQKTVDCGSCACEPACADCQTCQVQADGAGICITDPNQRGDACGDPGQVCRADGMCACDATSCRNPTPLCADGSCVSCAEDAVCRASGQGDLCCNGECVAGICCADAECAPSGNACVDHQCRCGAGGACGGSASNCCGAPGSCVNTQADADNCGECGITCGANGRCWNGDCVCGDVCASGCQFSTVQAAIDALHAGSTIRICAGRLGRISVSKDLTLIGAGDGEDPASNTILDAAGAAEVVVLIGDGVEVTLRGLRLTGSDNLPENVGGGLFNLGSSLEMTGCTISGNQAGDAGAMFNGADSEARLTDCTIASNGSTGGLAAIENLGIMTLTRCTVRENVSANLGGGASNHGELTLDDTDFTLNRAEVGGGIYNNGTLLLTNHSTIIANFARSQGGGIFNDFFGSLTCDGTGHISGNDAEEGGGIYNDSVTGFVDLNGTPVTGNTPDNCFGISVPGCVG